ncbi:Conserved_hypothetical protein [Hexamita inflata]|uniref:Uncharacterized protein n=1 Tax=Hexamita inflata TaxID=28002 RepID=A0ABP1HBV4_9EUKA
MFCLQLKKQINIERKEEEEKMNFFGIEVKYSTINKLFGIRKQKDVLDQKINNLEYLIRLEKSGIEVQVDDDRTDREDIWVMKQILKNTNFWLITGAGLGTCVFAKQFIKWMVGQVE